MQRNMGLPGAPSLDFFFSTGTVAGEVKVARRYAENP